MREIWRPLRTGIYEISSLGRVRRAKPPHCAPRKNCYVGYVYPQRLSDDGYPVVASLGSVHKLVAEVFLGPRPKGTEVNHKDSVKTNNTFTNLEYITHADNIAHAKRRGSYKGNAGQIGEDNPAAILTWVEARKIRSLFKTGRYSQRGIAALLGISKGMVHDVVRNKCWKE
jgi:hypothetical protein